MTAVINAIITWLVIWVITFVAMAEYGRRNGQDFGLAIAGFFVVGPIVATMSVIVKVLVW